MNICIIFFCVFPLHGHMMLDKPGKRLPGQHNFVENTYLWMWLCELTLNFQGLKHISITLLVEELCIIENGTNPIPRKEHA